MGENHRTVPLAFSDRLQIVLNETLQPEIGAEGLQLDQAEPTESDNEAGASIDLAFLDADNGIDIVSDLKEASAEEHAEAEDLQPKAELIPRELLSFIPSSRQQIDKERRQYYAFPDDIEQAYEDAAMLASERELSAGRVSAGIAELKEETEEVARGISSDFLTDERQADLVEDKKYTHVNALMLRNAFRTRLVPALEKRLNLSQLEIDAMLSNPELVAATQDARTFYEKKMTMSGQSPYAFGAKRAYDFRLYPQVVEPYVAKVVTGWIISEATAGYDLEADPALTADNNRTFSIKSLIGILQKQRFVALEDRIQAVRNDEDWKMSQIEQAFAAASIDVQAELKQIEKRIAAPALGNPGSLDGVYIFGEGKSGQLSSTLDTLQRFGGTDYDILQVRTGVGGELIGYRIICRVGEDDDEANEDDGEANTESNLKNRILAAAGNYLSHIPHKNDSAFHKVAMVGLLASGPDGTAMEPAVFEMRRAGNDGELMGEMEIYYDIVIERVTQQVFMEIQRYWREIEALNGMIPVGEEISLFENEERKAIQGQIPRIVSHQLEENKAWRQRLNSLPPQIELDTPEEN